MSTQHKVEPTQAELGLYHGPRPDIYHSTEWSLNTGLSLHLGPGPGGPILLREGLSMLLRKINIYFPLQIGCDIQPTIAQKIFRY